MIHLIKLAVGIRDPGHLEAVQRARAEARGDLATRRGFTRRRPVRPDADEGSLYWVIGGLIRCRQRLLGFETALDDAGKPYCLFILGPDLVATAPTPRRPFQGWRYLEPDAAPPDLPRGFGEPPPEEMLSELRELGLL
jgi:hypothetical protein